MRGKLFGVVPYDFERPSVHKVRDRMWNPADDAVLVPQPFGVGWTFNFASLKRRYPAAFWALVGFIGWRALRRLRAPT